MQKEKSNYEKLKRRYCAAKGICMPREKTSAKKLSVKNEKTGQLKMF